MTLFETLNEIDWSLVLLVLSIGEIAKNRLKKVSSFWAVMLVTTPFVLIYGYLARMDGQSWKTLFVSYFFAFWVYPFAVKPLKNWLKNLKSY